MEMNNNSLQSRVLSITFCKMMMMISSDYPTDQNDLMGEAHQKQNGIDGTNGTNGHAMETEQPEADKPAAAKPALRMSFAEYRRLSNLLILHMQKMEQRKTPASAGIL